MNCFSASQQSLSICILLLPGSSMMSLASTLDPMRAANRVSGRTLFRWKLVSFDGEPAKLTCDIPIPVESELTTKDSGDLLLVVAGFNQDVLAGRAELHLLRQLAKRFVMVGGVEAGSWILARAGLLDGRHATTHWEDLEDFTRKFPQVHVSPERYVIDPPVLTTGGASPTFSLMLRLIRSRYGYPLALEVAGAFIHDDRISDSDVQSLVPQGSLTRIEPRVARAIREMEKTLEAPVPMNEIARHANVSKRMLEHLFKQTLQTTPAAFYRRLRLHSARRLVTDTRLNLREIAIRTGFSSLPAFSRAFRQYFQQTPGECRRQALIKA